MVTRNITKNTATQVNSDKIGVLVHPDVTPGYDVVDGIIVDYTYQYLEVSSSEDQPIIIESEDGVLYQPANRQVEIPGGNTLFVWEAINYDPENPPTYIELGTVEGYEDVNVNSWMFTIDTDEFVEMVVSKTGGSGFGGNFIITSPGRCYNENYGYYNISGNNLSDDNGNIVGNIDNTVTETVNDLLFNLVGHYDPYYVWTTDHLVSEEFGIRSLYTTSNPPLINDTAYFDDTYTSFNPQTVKALHTHSVPPYSDEVNCTVSYSIDGKTWTNYPDNLTDDNNVICNIPRYMYLKFSQDVEITEE